MHMAVCDTACTVAGYVLICRQLEEAVGEASARVNALRADIQGASNQVRLFFHLFGWCFYNTQFDHKSTKLCIWLVSHGHIFVPHLDTLMFVSHMFTSVVHIYSQSGLVVGLMTGKARGDLTGVYGR